MEEVRFRAVTHEDWRGLGGEGIGTDDNGSLTLLSTTKSGKLSLGILDSGINDCIWNRLAVLAEIPDNSSIGFVIRASNDGTNFEQAEEVILRPGNRDALIMGSNRDEIAGRFIEVTVRLQRTGSKSPILSQILFYYPRITYLRYLPAAYQEDEASRKFLERFLSVFETDLQESEDLITNISSFIDLASAPADFLPWLAKWLELDLYELMGERNRDYLANAVELYKWKGTARGLKALVEILTARRCCIREFGKSIFKSYGKENMLAGSNESSDYSGDCGFSARNVSLTVDTNKLDPVEKGSFRDRLHYVMETGSDSLYSANIVGIYILLVGNEGLPVDRDDLEHIIDSFLPVYVRSRIQVVNIEPTRVLHATDLIQEKVGVAITKYTNERINALKTRHSYKDRSSFSVLKSWGAKAGGTSNSTEDRTYHRAISGTLMP